MAAFAGLLVLVLVVVSLMMLVVVAAAAAVPAVAAVLGVVVDLIHSEFHTSWLQPRLLREKRTKGKERLVVEAVVLNILDTISEEIVIFPFRQSCTEH